MTFGTLSLRIRREFLCKLFLFNDLRLTVTYDSRSPKPMLETNVCPSIS